MSDENENKTHYRKAFNSPYLSSQDIVEPVVLTISRVVLEPDKSKKSKDLFNTAYFAEKTIRKGEPLKPMILNAVNSKTVKTLAGGSPYIDDWKNLPVLVYVESGIHFGRDLVDGLRISHAPAKVEKPKLQEGSKMWASAVSAYVRDGNLNSITERVSLTKKQSESIISEAQSFIDESTGDK